MSGRRAHVRGLSLLEVMVSQTIALVILTSMMALLGAMITRLQAESATSDAQVRLRQVTHLLLRDTQAVGAASGGATGDVIFITDGGTNAPDTFTIFRRDESVCGGSLTVTPGVNYASTTNVPLANVGGACPFVQPSCPAAEIGDRSIQLMGVGGAMAVRGASAATCRVAVPASGTSADRARAIFNARYNRNLGTMNAVLGAIQPTQMLIGSNFTYRINGTNLERSTDDGATFSIVLRNVLDLQVVRVYVRTDGEEVHVSATTGTALPGGITEDQFVGLRLGIITFSKTKDGLVVAPPARFGNRNHTGVAGTRYRSSFVFAASRNR